MNISHLLDYGKVVAGRVGDLKLLPKTLAPQASSFIAEHKKVMAAADKADKAQALRDKKLAAVGDADDVLDPSVLALANAQVGAGLGDRKNPFAAYSRYTPSVMVDLPYVTEAKAVHDLFAAIKDKSPPPAVLKQAQACNDNATALEKALENLIPAQAAYVQALGERDALLPEYQKSLHRFKKHAAAAWVDEPATYKSVFAPAERIQQPVKRRKKKAGTGTGTQAPQAVKGAEAQPLLVVEPEELAAAGGEPAVAKGKKK